MKLSTLALVALLLVGCYLPSPPVPDFSVGDINVTLDTSQGALPTWTAPAELAKEIERVVRVAEEVTGKTTPPLHVTFVYGEFYCGRILSVGCYGASHVPGQAAGLRVSVGFPDRWSESREQYVSLETQCLLDTAFLHELLHHLMQWTDTHNHDELKAMQIEVERRLGELYIKRISWR